MRWHLPILSGALALSLGLSAWAKPPIAEPAPPPKAEPAPPPKAEPAPPPKAEPAPPPKAEPAQAALTEPAAVLADNCCCEPGPRLTAYANALFLHRSTPNSEVLFQDATTGQSLLNASQFDFNWEPGWEVGGAVNVGRKAAVELRYFQIDNWTSTVGSVPPNIVQINTAVPLFALGATSLSTTYGSDLHSAEINGRYQIRKWLGVLAGYRHLQLSEDLANTTGFGAANSANVNLSTDNSLNGGQVGVELGFQRERVGLQVRGLGGVYHNNATASFDVSQTTGPLFNASGESDHTAFAGELQIKGQVKVTKHVALQVGYQLLWLDGVALAPEQLSRANPVTQGINLTNSGSPFYHGAFAGIGVTW